MKKLLAIALCLSFALSVAACGAPETDFKSLDGKTLFVGSSASFTDVTDSIQTKAYLTYEVAVTYTLRRSSYGSNYDSVQVGSYYYYWETDTVTQEQQLGNRTTKTTVKHKYLPFGAEPENVMVKTTTVTEVSFDFAGGFVEKPRTVTINLNGYFASFDALKTASEELAARIDTSETKKYFVDTHIPVDIRTTENSYKSTYYYFE